MIEPMIATQTVQNRLIASESVRIRPAAFESIQNRPVASESDQNRPEPLKSIESSWVITNARQGKQNLLSKSTVIEVVIGPGPIATVANCPQRPLHRSRRDKAHYAEYSVAQGLCVLR